MAKKTKSDEEFGETRVTCLNCGKKFLVEANLKIPITPGEPFFCSDKCFERFHT